MSNGDKTLIDKASESVNSIGQAVSSITESATNAYANAKESVSNTLDEYSSKNIINASSGFLSSNGMIAKFFFLILVLGAFIFFFYLGMQIIGFFMGGATNVYVISGLIPDMKAYNVVITTNNTMPISDTNVPIARSNNKETGLEFTWCCWLNLEPAYNITDTKEIYNLIFAKGSGINFNANGSTLDSSYNVSTTNCPGLYLYNNNKIQPGSLANMSTYDTKSNILSIMIDTVVSSITDMSANISSRGPQIIDISNIPINKWFHIAIRCQNKNIDIYVNGVIYYRSVLPNPPRQNSDSIHVADTNPAAGKLSDLRYFSYALSIININSIVNAGPSLKLNARFATSTSKTSDKNTNASYLSNNWYTKY
jgi:hypothetical protein